MNAAPPAIRRVLYYSGRKPLRDQFFTALAGLSECRTRQEPGRTVVTCPAAAFSFAVRNDLESTLEALHREFFNLVVLDLREPVLGRRRATGDFDRGLALLEAMDSEPDVEQRYGFHRILVLVSGTDSIEVDNRIVTLGARGVGRVIRDLATCHHNPGCALLPSEQDFARRVFDEMSHMTLQRHPGQRAICASGGGITGLYFELGVLKCLEDCMPPGALNEFDLYFGISAGGVALGLLANGYAVSEFMASIAGHEGGRLRPNDLSLLDPAHLDLRGITAPVRQLLAIARQGAGELLRLRLPFSLGSLVFEYGDLIHAPFNTAGFEALLRECFTQEGCTNEFAKLPHRLYIGATDQDRKEHVLFGEAPHDDVPISRAIQASMSLNPVFAPTEIGDRFYEDGAVTRTSNFSDAIRKGADLIFTLDPLVPYVSKRAGFARSRGVFYNADQDIRTVSFTRYDTTRKWALRRHPEVSLYTFLPANQLRKTLSVNPMDHRSFLEIWRGAYLGTLRRIHTLGYRMRGDLAAHGVPFDSSSADAIGERLTATRQPTFADFFVDGKIDLRAPGRRRVPVEARRGPHAVADDPAA